MSNGRLMRILIACAGIAAAALNIAFLLGILPRSVTSTGALLVLLCWGAIVILKRARTERQARAAEGEDPPADDKRERIQDGRFDRIVGGIAAAALAIWIITLGLTLFHGA